MFRKQSFVFVFKLRSFYFFFYMRGYFACVFYVPRVQYPQRPEEGVGPPGTGVTDCCQLPHWNWNRTQVPPQEQPVPITPEPSLDPAPISSSLRAKPLITVPPLH